MARKQTEFDYHRGAQLRMLRDIHIPTVRLAPQRSVGGSTIKSVLRQIDDYGRGRSCWPGIDTIARDVGRGEATVRRAVDALEFLELIDRRRRICPDGCTRLHFIIFWDVVEIMAKRREHPVAVTAYQVVTTTDQPVTTTDQPVTTTDRSLYRKRNGSAQEPPPPQPLAGNDQIPSTKSQTWEEAEEAVFQCGVTTASRLVAKARDAGLSPQDVLTLAGIYQQERDDWQGPGALHFAILHYRPGLDPADDRCWPASDQRKRRREAQRAAARAKAAEIIRQGRAKRASDAQITAVLAKYQLTWSDAGQRPPAELATHERSHE